MKRVDVKMQDEPYDSLRQEADSLNISMGEVLLRLWCEKHGVDPATVVMPKLKTGPKPKPKRSKRK